MVFTRRILRRLYSHLTNHTPKTSAELKEALAIFCMRERLSTGQALIYYDYLVKQGYLPRIED